MNWNSLNKMVLRCFKVTVPDPVLLRCYQGSETTTNQKQGGLQSLSASSPPPFGAVSLDLCLPCLSLLWAVLFYCSSLAGQTERQVSKTAGLLTVTGVGLPGLEVAALWGHICPLGPHEKRRAKGFFFFLRKESRVLQSLLTWQAVS